MTSYLKTSAIHIITPQLQLYIEAMHEQKVSAAFSSIQKR